MNINNIIKLKPNNKETPIWADMTLALELMPSRGISVTVFIALLKDINVDFGLNTRVHYDNLINTYGKAGWMQFLIDIGRLSA